MRAPIALYRLLVFVWGATSCAASTLLYVRDYSSGSIDAVDSSGSIAPIFQDQTDLQSMHLITIGADGTIYLNGEVETSDGDGGTVYTYKLYSYAPGGSLNLIPTSPQISSTSLEGWLNIGVTSNNSIYISMFGVGNGISTQLVSGSGYLGVANPVPLGTWNTAVDPAGNIYWATRSALTKYTQAGTNSQLALSSNFSNSAALSGPIAVDSKGDVFVSTPTSGSEGVYEVDADGDVSTVATGIAGYLAVDAENDVFVNDSGTLYEVTPSGQESTVATGLPNAPIVAAVTPVPEPGVGCFLGVAGLMLGRYRRRATVVRV